MWAEPSSRTRYSWVQKKVAYPFPRDVDQLKPTPLRPSRLMNRTSKQNDADSYETETTKQCHPWEEIYHPVTGKKHWRHRQTGELRYKDPLR